MNFVVRLCCSLMLGDDFDAAHDVAIKQLVNAGQYSSEEAARIAHPDARSATQRLQEVLGNGPDFQKG